jgi:hypothetical protein
MGTDCSRQQHYIYFAQEELKLKDPTLSDYHPETAPVVMALDTEHMCTWHTLKSKLVRKTTVDQYLKEAAEYCIHHKNGKQDTARADPWIDGATEEVHILISSALKELKRWEEVPNQRQPPTKQMIGHLKTLVKSKHADSLKESITD